MPRPERGAGGGSRLRQPPPHRLRQALARLIYRWDRLGLLNGTRDFRYFHELLVELHLAVWAGEPLRIGGTVLRDDLRVVVERIRGLVGRKVALEDRDALR